MKRSSRLTRSEDIQRVRQRGRSFAHVTVVINVLPNQVGLNRIAVIAGRSVGGAVQRNLAKRRIRSVIQNLQRDLHQGYDLVVIARSPFLEFDYKSILDAIKLLFERAELMKDTVS